MEKALVAAVGAVALATVCSCGRPSDFSAQYVTLPNGSKAFCNRQGYREIRRTYTYEQNTLVTRPDGNFVPCDARIGPEWDSQRTSASGHLLSPEQMDKAQIQHEIALANSPEAIAAQQADENVRQQEQYKIDLMEASCPVAGGRYASWFKAVTGRDGSVINWATKRREFHSACTSEDEALAARQQALNAQAQSQQQAEAAAKQEADSAYERQREACQLPYTTALRVHNDAQTVASRDALIAAGDIMKQCFSDLEQTSPR